LIAVYQFLVHGPCPSSPDTVIWYSKQKNKKLLMTRDNSRPQVCAMRPTGRGW